MILNDRQIEALVIEEGLITPFSGKVSRGLSHGLSSFGYDLRLSHLSVFTYSAAPAGDIAVLDTPDPERLGYHLELLTDDNGNDYYRLPPYSVSLASSLERFALPPTITGLIFGKSTYARAGLSLNTTAAEAGWSGYLTLELTNSTPRFLRVYPGRGIAQIHFFKGDSPNAPYKGKYQSQGETPRIYDNGG